MIKHLDPFTEIPNDVIEAAIERYNDYAGNIRIFEGVADISVAEIEEKVRNHIKLTGRKPVIMIDYIQILAASDKHMTDKQKTDENVTALKRLSRDLDIPVLGISSFNRDNYREPVSMASFKESGAVEYSSDVLIGLQYYGMDYKKGEGQTARNNRVRELLAAQSGIASNGQAQDIQIKILKNRNGRRDYVRLDYYPMFNYFTDSSRKEEEETEDGGEWKPATKSGEGKAGEWDYIPLDGHKPGDLVKIERKNNDDIDSILEDF